MSPPARGTARDAELAAALAESQRLGMLGDRPIADVIEHAGRLRHRPRRGHRNGRRSRQWRRRARPRDRPGAARPATGARRPPIQPHRPPAAARRPARPCRPGRGGHHRRDHPRRRRRGSPTRSSPEASERRQRRSAPRRRSCDRTAAASSWSASRPIGSPTDGHQICSTSSGSSPSLTPTAGWRCSAGPVRVRGHDRRPRRRPSRRSPSCSRSGDGPTRRAPR